MYRIISNNQVVAICDRFRWVRMMDGVLVGTIKATAQGFEARVPVHDGDTYHFDKQVYALEPGGLTGSEPVASLVEFHGAVDLQDRDAVLGILAGERVTKKAARGLRAVIETAVQSLPDETALEAVTLHPAWADLVGKTVEKSGYRFQHDGLLYKTIPAGHTFAAEWVPGVGTESLYTRIDETHAGTLEDPVPYEGNMALVAGLYYVQDGVVYLCNRDTGAPVYNALSDLVGLYVEVV